MPTTWRDMRAPVVQCSVAEAWAVADQWPVISGQLPVGAPSDSQELSCVFTGGWLLAIGNDSWNLHFRGRDYRGIVAGDGEDGQVYSAYAPAVVFQDSLERRHAVDIAEQSDGGGIKVGRDLHLRLLGRIDDGLNGQVVAK